MIPAPFAALAAYPQFVLTRYVPLADGKTTKLPCNPRTLEVADAHDPTIWVDAETAIATAALLGENYGYSFVLTEQDPFWFVDIDHCLENGQWSPIALDLCARLSGAAVEISQSGTGLHIIGTYSGPAPPHKCKNAALGLELYTEKRFIALTGNGAVGNAGFAVDAPLQSVIDEYFPADSTESGSPADWRDTPDPAWCGPEDDAELIRRMMSTKSASASFGKSASIRDLWEGNDDALAKAYPSLNDHDVYDRSSADAALAMHLAFWTGKNHERIERLMRQSALVREKWDRHKSYLRDKTIVGAVARTRNVYQDKRQPAEPVEPVKPSSTFRSTAELTVGMQFLGVEQELEHFAGCTYVQDRHGVLTPAGVILKPDQFRATYGGYEFALTADNTKTTKNAWEAFAENQAIRFPKVSSTCFRPEVESGSIVEEEGRTMVNTYVPINTRRVQGDPTRFLELTKKTLPDDRDREILISYMAACVQYPGRKFQWCPLLQGVEGNGKSLFMRVLAHAIGHRYTHLPNASELGAGGQKFNAWIQGKLFIGVEEIYVTDKREIADALKPLITNDRIEIQGKGVDQTTGDNRANFIMCTNHKDALHISLDGRRYCVLYSAQQTAEDIARDGMDGSYFPSLYHWLKHEDGYAIVNEYLHTYQIAEKFNPATLCQRAPATSSTLEAVALSLGAIEQEVMEAIEEGRAGFAGGWVSSFAVDKLLAQLKAERRIPRRQRKTMMESLGYVLHPGLPGGRVNNPVFAEGGKPRLYIKVGHLGANLVGPAAIHAAYMKAQNYPDMGVDASVNKV